MIKKLIRSTLALTLIGAAALSISACGTSSDDSTVKVGYCPGPYGDMFEQAIAPSLEEKGYSVELIEFSDYVQPNMALSDGEINVNLFQHSIYLDIFSTEHDLDLTSLKEVPTAGMGVFSDEYSSLDDIEDGAMVAIPNDETNLSRAIRVLEQTGLVTIADDVDPATATQYDLSENPKNLQFTEIEAPQLPRTLDSVGLAVITGNFAISAGLDLGDALYNEVLDEGYLNVIVMRAQDEDSQLAKDILEIVNSDAFKSVIDDPDGDFYTFQRPSNY